MVRVALLAMLGAGAAQAAGDLSGFVRDEAALPISSAWVDAYNASNVRVDSGLTDASGAFTITNLGGGTYYLLTDVSVGNYVDEWYSNVVATSSEIPTNATGVVVTSGAVSNINFYLAAGGTISGRVTTVTNSALANVWVDAYDSTGSRRGSGLTDATGVFAIEGLPEAAFYVRTDAIGLNVADEWYDNVPVAGSDVASGARTVSVVAGAVTGFVNFALSPGARLAGRVTVTGGAPLGSVWVDAYQPGGTLVDSGLTATDGVYAVTGLPAGTYYARTYVGAANYANEWYDNVAVIGVDVPSDTAQALVLAAGGAFTNANFVLAAGGGIAGSVTNVAGPTLGGVWVDVYAADGTWVTSVQTATTGVYGVSGLPAGAFYARTYAGTTNLVDEWYDDVIVAGSGIPAAADAIAVATGVVTSAIHFGLRAGGIIAGQVTRTNGTPLAGLTVSAYDVTTNWVKGATTDTGGVYRLQGLPAPGAYYVVTEAGTVNVVDEWFDNKPVMGTSLPAGALALAVSPGVTTGGVAFALADGGTVSGLVTGSGAAPLAGATVALYDALTNRVATATTQSDGTYGVTGVPAGGYRVRVEAGSLNYADEWWNDVAALGFGIPVSAATVTVAAGGSVTGITFRLAAGGTLSGRVTDTVPAALSSVVVDAYDAQTNWLKSAVTDIDGDYALQGVSTQRLVYVRTYVGSANYVNEWYLNVAVLDEGIGSGAQGLNLTTGAVSGIDFALAEGGIVAGFVGDVASSPLSGVGVDVYTSGGVPLASGDTDANGAFAVSRLPTGSYYVRTAVDGLGFEDAWYAGVPVAGSGIPGGASTVLAQSGLTTNVNFALGFEVVQVGLTNGYARVLWQAASGTAYQVEESTDLTAWTNAVSGSNSLEQSAVTAPAQQVLEFRNPQSVSSNVFYRIRVDL